MPPISILHLEDSELDAELELATLQRAKLDVVITHVVYRAQFEAALQSQEFDLILADFHLPDFDGMEALTFARKTAPRTPFIFVSGALGEEIAIETLRNGATDYVLKARLQRLVPAVERALSEARDRAERRRMQAALIETEGRFRNMADSAPVMIWTAEADKRWNYCNRLWVDFTGLSMERSSGSGWAGLVNPQDLNRVLETYDAAFRKRKEFTLEYRLLRKDGEYRWVLNRATPRFDQDQTFVGFIGSCIDINDLKVGEERVRHAAKLESLGVLAGGIAHDFNNLLTGIMGNASLVLDDLPPGSQNAECMETIVSASETAAQLTRQMLAFSGKGHFLLEQVNVSKVVRETLPLIEASVPRSTVMKLELDAALPPIEADLGQIQQVVMNLVINAGEAIGPAPGGLLVITTRVAELDAAGAAELLVNFAVPPGRYAMLAVSDNGHGMDQDTKVRVFDPFFTTKFIGRGLGLAAVSGIVRGHHAGLALRSDLEQGTEFRVYFPISTKAVPRSTSGKAAAVEGSGTVLVVDDEPVVLRSAQVALEKYGFQVLSAKDGQEAVNIYRERAEEIDLVILDLAMPVMSGDEAFRAMRAIRSDVRVLASSGFSEAEAMTRFGADVDAFIQKPYRAKFLVEQVQTVLAKR